MKKYRYIGKYEAGMPSLGLSLTPNTEYTPAGPEQERIMQASAFFEPVEESKPAPNKKDKDGGK